MVEAKLGVIGGSGIYDVEDLTIIDEVAMDTPFGKPSDPVRIGTSGKGLNIAFISRHGKGHRYLPTEVNSRANIWALKKLGVTKIFSLSAVGSLKEEMAPTHVCTPDQIIDRTRSRDNSFFGEGVVGHVTFADPFCNCFRKAINEAARASDATLHEGGIYVCMEGPLFSTRAESNLHRSWGASIIGMTALPEAKLAREAEICYATLALITDYDCWHEEEEDVSVEMVLETMNKNSILAKKVLKTVAENFDAIEEDCGCSEAAKYAVMTAPEAMDKHTVEKLSLFYGKYWDKS